MPIIKKHLSKNIKVVNHLTSWSNLKIITVTENTVENITTTNTLTNSNIILSDTESSNSTQTLTQIMYKFIYLIYLKKLNFLYYISKFMYSYNINNLKNFKLNPNWLRVGILPYWKINNNIYLLIGIYKVSDTKFEVLYQVDIKELLKQLKMGHLENLMKKQSNSLVVMKSK